MVKRKTNIQNIVIIILSILLLISIGFGVTYSYYNGKSNLVKGSITTATLSISLHGQNQFGQTTDFSISAPYGEEFLVPGNGLNNLVLNLYNQCNQRTYMVVKYSLEATKTVYEQGDDGEWRAVKKNITDQLTTTPAVAFKDDAFDSSKWKSILYSDVTGSYTCLVGLNPFEAKEPSTEGYYIPVLNKDKIKIPEQWSDLLQNCEVTICVTAFAIQAENLGNDYLLPILEAEADHNMEAKAQAIAKATLEICKANEPVKQ